MHKGFDTILGEIQQTLLLPLAGRVRFAAMDGSSFRDEKAREIVSFLAKHMEKHIRAVDLYSALCYGSRALMMDEAVRQFTRRHSTATIVNLGAGLDTAFYRIDNGSIQWIDIDLPDVIALRERLLPPGLRNRVIGKSIFDSSWFHELVGSDRILMLCGGVFMYYSEAQVRDFFIEASRYFKEAEILLDVLSEEAVRECNSIASRADGGNVPMKWGIKDPVVFGEWSHQIELVGQYSYFGHIEKSSAWDSMVLDEMRKTDDLKLSSFMHLRLGNAVGHYAQGHSQ